MSRLTLCLGLFLASFALAARGASAGDAQVYAVWRVEYGDGTVRFFGWTPGDVRNEQQQAEHFYYEQLRRWREDKKLPKPKKAAFKQVSKWTPELEKVNAEASKLQKEYDEERRKEEELEKLKEELKKEGLTIRDIKTFTVMELETKDGPKYEAVTLADFKRKEKQLSEEYKTKLLEWVKARAAAEKAGKEFNEPKPRPLVRKHSSFRDKESAEEYKTRLEEKRDKKEDEKGAEKE